MLPNKDEIRSSLYSLLPDHKDYLDSNVFDHFLLADDVLVKLRDLLDANISQFIVSDTSKLKQCTSFVTEALVPDGSESETTLALDFGGTNIRVLKVTFGGPQLEKQMTARAIPTALLSGTAVQLFDFIADVLHTFLEEHVLLNTRDAIPLGFSFSYPVRQTALNVAFLQKWTKDFDCNDAIGQDVGKLLKDAISRKGSMNIDVDAIINDTVGTLIAGTLIDRNCAVGLICGTGTNGSYFQSLVQLNHGRTYEENMVALDARWNDFGNDGVTDFVRSEYDLEVSRNSTHQEEMIFEKMMCGLFTGELVRLVLRKMHAENVCFLGNWSQKLETRGGLSTHFVSDVLSHPNGDMAGEVLSRLGVSRPSHTECMVVFHVCQLVTLRAAYLTAACTACLVNRIDRPEVAIAVGGHFYSGNPLLHELLADKMKHLVRPNIKVITRFKEYGHDLRRNGL